MKKVKMLKYLNHYDLTGGEQFLADEIVEVTNQVAEVLVGSGHAEYVPEPKKTKAKKEPKIEVDNDDNSEVVP